jgi:hypothetical protein
MPFLNIDLQRALMLKKYAAIPFAVMCLTSQLALAEEPKTLSSVVITATKTEQDSFDFK